MISDLSHKKNAETISTTTAMAKSMRIAVSVRVAKPDLVIQVLQPLEKWGRVQMEHKPAKMEPGARLAQVKSNQALNSAATTKTTTAMEKSTNSPAVKEIARMVKAVLVMVVLQEPEV